MGEETSRPKDLNDVPGWFTLVDQLLFEWILTYQSETQPPGDLVELGVYLGKSAIQMGRFRSPDEKFTVCDLFDDARDESTIREDARRQYRTLSQAAFEENYSAFHQELPTVLRGLTSIIDEHVAADSCRFVHIDASHMYEHVRLDTAAANRMLRPGGVVVFDDYRTEHTIGTAAAVWEAIVADGLKPICCSSMKLYGTWGDPTGIQQEIYRRISERTDMRADTYEIMGGETIIRAVHVAPKKQAPAPKTPAASDVALEKAEAALVETKKLRQELRAAENNTFDRRLRRRVKRVLRR